MNSLPPPVGLGNTSSPLNLSKATKLRHVGFRFATPTVQWISITPQSAQLDALRRISIISGAFFATTEEVDRGWQELDQLLVRLWTSHSIYPKSYVRVCPGRVYTKFVPRAREQGRRLGNTTIPTLGTGTMVIILQRCNWF